MSVTDKVKSATEKVLSVTDKVRSGAEKAPSPGAGGPRVRFRKGEIHTILATRPVLRFNARKFHTRMTTDPTSPPPASPLPEIPPPPGPDATPEEKDLYWFKHVYQGDKVPQFTWRAVLVGGVIGMVMAASNLYTSIKLGWAFGVTITACVLAYSLGSLMRGFGMKPLTMLENNCMQSTASAAGYSTGGTVAAAFT